MKDNFDELLDVVTILRTERRLRDMTLAQVSKEMKISQGYICEIEKGKKRPNINFVKSYAKLFGFKLNIGLENMK